MASSKKILLVSGAHDIVVRQAGYKISPTGWMFGPGGTQVVRVAIEKDLRMQTPTITAEIKLSVIPDRAAVFVELMKSTALRQVRSVSDSEFTVCVFQASTHAQQ